MYYHCCTETRRNAVKLHPALNGIDYLEVLDQHSDPYQEREAVLFLYFLKTVPAGSLDQSNFHITGGESIRGVKVETVESLSTYVLPAAPPEEAEQVLVIKLNKIGDFSPYSLQLIDAGNPSMTPESYDPVLAKVQFSFRSGCQGDLDCLDATECQEILPSSPQINYLAKDFASFRQLMLDRMALLAPGWTERNIADQGIVLLELLAYTADYLSYRQDAIGTEAYLSTSRKRISVRRHARLVDYFMHDGCNARTWAHIQVGPHVDDLLMEKGEGSKRIKILTQVEGLPRTIKVDSADFKHALNAGAKVFELMHDVYLHSAHNEMRFYTWGEQECCLVKGATQATLADHYPKLKRGDVLILSEVMGPATGKRQDSDPMHYHAVLLTAVEHFQDINFDTPFDEEEIEYITVTQITWHAEDALPFPLCISNEQFDNISVALGNIALVDHGLTIEDQRTSSLVPDTVPKSNLAYVGRDQGHNSRGKPQPSSAVPHRYQPILNRQPLTFSAPLTNEQNNPMQSATAMTQSSVKAAMPQISLRQTGPGIQSGSAAEWKPQRDLLNSFAQSHEFVVEMETDGIAHIRFGDGIHGERPASESNFKATYRIGNGPSGNIGARTLFHLASDDAILLAQVDPIQPLWNPLPAKGGTKVESLEEVRQYAPQAFHLPERAVTMSDYEALAKRCKPSIQRAAARLRWTGSWKTVFLSVDQLGGATTDDGFESKLRDCLEVYRMAGFDLEVEEPVYVALEVEMKVCISPHFFKDEIKQVLNRIFSNRRPANGQLAVFHPDNFSFGQTVYLSRLYAAAQAVRGVEFVRITKFQRKDKPSSDPLNEGKLILGRREIARCDNDLNFPNRGTFDLILEGGRV